MEVLGFLTSVRHLPEDLERAFFSTRFTRVLDFFGYARIGHWKIYAEEELAKREVTLWLGPEVLAAGYAGEPLARYDVRYSPGARRLREVKRPTLFETSFQRSRLQSRPFRLDALGKGGRVKAPKLEGYAARRPRRSETPSLQGALFAYHKAWR